MSGNVDDCVHIDRNKSRRGKVSAPAKGDLDGNGNDDGGRIARLFDDEGGSANLNVERIIDTEQETSDEPLLSSLA